MRPIENPKARQITFGRANELLDYNSAAGLFKWRINRSPRIRAGDPAGCVNWVTGYVQLRIDYVTHLAHRIAWLLCYGNLPSDQIDHIDTDRTNNRIDNLREASQSQNQANAVGRPKKYGAGLRGAFWDKSNQSWRAAVVKDGKQIHIGSFSSELDAHLAYCAVAKALHGEFARSL